MGEARLKTLSFNRKILSSIFTKTDWATMPQLEFTYRPVRTLGMTSTSHHYYTIYGTKT